ncbi:hypothetical protein KBD75_04410 [Candidatus Woesebacteria bacterium]|nr:hypothetical protein [Candidatus Woesebacteria bacterium]
MIEFEEAVRIAEHQLSSEGVELTIFPILKLSKKDTVYWGENSSILHSGMVKQIGVSAKNVSYAARVSIAPEYHIFMLNDAGSTIEKNGYLLNPDEKLIVQSYLCEVFRSVASGPYSLE